MWGLSSAIPLPPPCHPDSQACPCLVTGQLTSLSLTLLGSLGTIPGPSPCLLAPPLPSGFPAWVVWGWAPGEAERSRV